MQCCQMSMAADCGQILKLGRYKRREERLLRGRVREVYGFRIPSPGLRYAHDQHNHKGCWKEKVRGLEQGQAEQEES